MIRLAEHHLTQGADPERIIFSSYTRRAVYEARQRLTAVAVDQDFPGVRTLHSLAYNLLGLSRDEVMRQEDLVELSELTGNTIHWGPMDIPLWEGTMGDRSMALWEMSRARGWDLKKAHHQMGLEDLPWSFVESFVRQYEDYKKHKGVVDFADMITLVTPQQMGVDLVFIDEAQDLTTAQWTLLEKVVGHSPIWYVAGDDDQSIYRWSGADPERFVKWKGTSETLPQSHRLPLEIKRFAERLTQRMTRRVPKTYLSTREGGHVQWLNDTGHIDLSEGSWLLLARSRYQLGEWRRLARQQGVVYTLPNGEWSWKLPSVRAAVVYERLRKGQSCKRDDALLLSELMRKPMDLAPGKVRWEWKDVPRGNLQHTWMQALRLPLSDVEYIRALRKRGESTNQPGRVRIGTVHSVKGAEADHVAVLTDVSGKVARSMHHDPDAELRVQYVACTRARHTLVLVEPNTPQHWEFR